MSLKQLPENTTEIERKFLLERLPPQIDRAPKSTIEQGYVALDPNGSEVRLRKKPERYFFLTAKSGGDLKRREAEIEIRENQFVKLWPLTEGRRIEKSRYEVTAGEIVIEVDVYDGSLAGLLIAEVEFPSIGASTELPLRNGSASK